MNPTKLALANAFLDAQPDAAARLLEQQPIAEVAALLNAAPRAHALRVTDALLPRFAAQVLAALQNDEAVRIVAGLPVHKAAQLLRLLAEARTATLLPALPAKTRAALRLLLNYSEDEVGAWMDIDLPVVALDSTVESALALLRRDDGADGAERLFVVNGGGRLAGCCSLLRCLRSPPQTPLRNLVAPAPLPLGGRTGLTAALTHPGWEDADLVPVINRQQLLLGGLSHHRLRRVLHRGGDVGAESASTDLVMLVTEAYGASLRGLFANTQSPAPSHSARHQSSHNRGAAGELP